MFVVSLSKDKSLKLVLLSGSSVVAGGFKGALFHWLMNHFYDLWLDNWECFSDWSTIHLISQLVHVPCFWSNCAEYFSLVLFEQYYLKKIFATQKNATQKMQLEKCNSKKCNSKAVENGHRKFYGQFEFLAGPWLWRRFPLFIRSFILLTHGSSVFVLKSFKISSNCLQKVFKISSNLQYPIQINFSSSVFFKFSISFSELSEDPSGAFSLRSCWRWDTRSKKFLLNIFWRDFP